MRRASPLPAYQSAGAAGLDLLAAVDAPVVLRPGKRALIPTGLILELPAGFEAQVRPRSGLALRHGITVLNSPGTIDSDYRGEVKVLLVNLGDRPVHGGARRAHRAAGGRPLRARHARRGRRRLPHPPRRRRLRLHRHAGRGRPKREG